MLYQEKSGNPLPQPLQKNGSVLNLISFMAENGPTGRGKRVHFFDDTTPPHQKKHRLPSKTMYTQQFIL
jgi:hypothetical protein